MKDTALDVQMHQVALLMSELKSFRDIVVSTLNTEVVVPENEARLAKIKETIPDAAKKLYSNLCENYDDAAEKIVHGVSDLSLLIKNSDLEKRKLLEAWHKYYLKLYFMNGRLKSRKEKVESLSFGKLKAKKLLFSPFTVIIVLAIIVFLVFIYLSK